MKKKKWGMPKLIILTRGKPGEGVLQACKNLVPWGGTGGPSSTQGGCWYSDVPWLPDRCDFACSDSPMS